MKKHLVFVLTLISIICSGQTANMDFEEGNFNNWILDIGERTSPAEINWFGIGPPGEMNRQIRMMNPSVPPLDEYGLLCDPALNIPTSFPGGAFSARIGDNPGGRRTARISRTFTVTAAESFLLYSYAVILEEPGHSQEEQPKFVVNIKDNSDTIVTCGNFEVFAGENAVEQGFVECEYDRDYRCDFPISDCPNGENGGFGTGIFTTPIQILQWQSGGADLSPYIGQEITIEFIAMDCLLGGHGGTAYVEATIQPLEIQVEGLCASGPNNITLTAPLGFDAYLWSTGETTRSIDVADAEYGDIYTVDLTSNTGCNTSTTITLAPVDTATIEPIEDQEICFGGSAIISPTGTNVGDFSFTDLGTTGNSAVVTPTATTTYTVIARDENGCEGESTTVTINVLNSTGSPFPNADFEFENVVNDINSPCNTVQFNNLSDYCKNDLTYLWDFGDGTTSTEENPLHVFPDNGFSESYSVTLTVTSIGDNLSDSKTETFTTSTIQPSFLVSEDCGTITISNNSSICGNSFDLYSNFTYTWDFGDGSPTETTDEVQSEIVHTYTTSEEFTISMTMVDALSDFEMSIDEQLTPTIGLTADFDFTLNCYDIQFTDLSTICDPIIAWEWDFGDGSPLNTGQSPMHTYATAGPHNVTLTVSDGTTTDSATIEVLLTPDVTTPDFGYTINCNEVQFSDLTDSCSPLTYEWNFDDGSPIETETEPLHTFEYDIVYTVTLTVNDGVQDFATTQTLTIPSEFQYDVPNNLNQCESEPGANSATFNLLEQSDHILANVNIFPQISYHLSQSDAENNTNVISTQFTNTTNPQDIFVRIEDSQGCHRIEQFDVQAFQTPIPVNIETILSCTMDTTESYDLDQLNAQIFEQIAQNNIEVSYHETESDANTANSPVSNITLIAGETQTIYIRIENIDYTTCYSVSTVNLRVDNEATDTEQRCMPFFSNTMTPNGDGANDVFYIENVTEFPNNQLTIYNRWGNIVYETNGYLNNWQGTYNGKTLPVGTYYFVFELGDNTGRKHSGYVAILR